MMPHDLNSVGLSSLPALGGRRQRVTQHHSPFLHAGKTSAAWAQELVARGRARATTGSCFLLGNLRTSHPRRLARWTSPITAVLC